MPNQRAKDKVRFGGCLPRELHAQVRGLAKQAGMSNNVFGFFMMLVQEGMELPEGKQGRGTGTRRLRLKLRLGLRVKGTSGGSG